MHIFISFEQKSCQCKAGQYRRISYFINAVSGTSAIRSPKRLLVFDKPDSQKREPSALSHLDFRVGICMPSFGIRGIQPSFPRRNPVSYHLHVASPTEFPRGNDEWGFLRQSWRLSEALIGCDCPAPDMGAGNFCHPHPPRRGVPLKHDATSLARVTKLTCTHQTWATQGVWFASGADRV